MKTYILVISSVLLSVFSAFSQTEMEKEEAKKNIERIDFTIASFEKKREWLMNNSEEKAIAEEENWFDKMDRTIAALRIERERYVNLLSGKTVLTKDQFEDLDEDSKTKVLSNPDKYIIK